MGISFQIFISFGIWMVTTSFTFHKIMASNTISPRVFRAGRVLAPDSKWTGEEPEWKGWESWTIGYFYRVKSRMLNFYSYYLSEADLKPGVAAYMTDAGYTPADIVLIQNSKNVMPLTVGKLIRSISRGMPPLHPGAAEYFMTLPFSDPDRPPIPKDDRDIIREEILTALRILQPPLVQKQPEAKVAAPMISIQDRLRLKVDREVITHLDEMLDRWILSSHMTRVDGLSMTSFIRDGNIPSAGCKPIIDWIIRQREEYRGAFDKSCDQLVEGYSHMSKPALKNRITVLEAMLDEVIKHSSTAKGVRKPREKKVKEAAKQIAALQYATQSDEFGLTSEDPLKIPGSQRVYLFNTKYRSLSVYNALGSGGFEVKGCGLRGYDPDRSYTTTLRKPIPSLEAVLTNMPKTIDKLFEDKKYKKRPSNGRLNLNTIILRIINNKI